MKKIPLIVIVGATASGKTDMGIAIAQKIDGEVICADSRTVYRGMNIGTAKPIEKNVPSEARIPLLHREGAGEVKLFSEKPFMVKGIPHWGLDLVNPDESFTAADFKIYAEKKIKEIFERGKTPILVGGTGLYISAVVDNLSFTKVGANEVLREKLDTRTNEELLERLREKDADAAETIDSANRRRLIRAIEIVEMTGKPLAQSQVKGEEKYEVLMIGIEVPRETLYERIELRVDSMIAEGLVDEVRHLKTEYGCQANAMTGIGYRQICAFLDGFMHLRDAVEVLKRDTKHYAKRQLTWFKRDPRIIWVHNTEEALERVRL